MAKIELPARRPSRSEDDHASAHAEDLERLARWMDSVFEIPVLGIRFGLDAVLGLLPGGGDVATSLVSIYIVSAAMRHGVPRITLARMALNVAIDLLVGSIPVLGDLFDAYWKSNQRNVALLRRHITAAPVSARKFRTADRLFVGGLVLLLIVVLIGSLTIAYFLIAWLIAALRGATA